MTDFDKSKELFDVGYCQECPNYSTGRDEMQSYCREGIDLGQAVWDKEGHIVIPSDCPLPSVIIDNREPVRQEDGSILLIDKVTKQVFAEDGTEVKKYI